MEIEITYMKNIFITGKPGCGKTTLIKEVCDRAIANIGGFYTEEIREKNQRKGFYIITLSGKKEIFAYKGLNSKYKLRDYGVDVEVLNRIGVKSITDALEDEKIKVIIVDEIGKMECFSDKFKEVIIKCLNSNKKLLATIRYSPDPFIDKIKKSKDSKVIILSRENYNEVKNGIVKWINQT